MGRGTGERLERVGRRRGAPGCCECGGNPLRSGSEVDRVAEGGSEADWVELACREADAGPGYFDAAGYFGLVAAERDGDDRYTVGERFLGDAHAGVADDARGVVEDGRVGHEPLDADVGGRGRRWLGRSRLL